jgi:NAD(P)-dependent dehydrogenase (short-subunit alcohol dehydrogenase family)
MSSVLITGANRGLGLEFVKQYQADGWRVYACCRKPGNATDLAALVDGSSGRVSVHALDVADHGAIDALAKELEGEALDVLLNNAGAFGDRAGFGSSDYDTWTRMFQVNSLGPMKMAEAFVPHVERGERKVIASVTSKMGSIGDNTSGSYYIYRSTKAALNMITKSMALDLGGRGISAVVLHPGWVKTDMGGMSAPLDPPQSVSGMRKVLSGVSLETSGTFFNYDGTTIPW